MNRQDQNGRGVMVETAESDRKHLRTGVSNKQNSIKETVNENGTTQQNKTVEICKLGGNVATTAAAIATVWL